MFFWPQADGPIFSLSSTALIGDCSVRLMVKVACGQKVHSLQFLSFRHSAGPLLALLRAMT